MLRKIIACVALAGALLLAGCHHKVQNPMAGIDSKQPDKGLYDRSMESMKKGRFTEARTLLETLINTYPESEYIARAKLAVGDSWYAEGGSTAWSQAEAEYKDFQTFFPNMPESAEAQLKVATIHYRQMEKPDRDFGQATRAAEEYRTLIQQYPDSPLVPEAKQRLREVQEVLADRQFRIAHFYYLRDNLAAAQARLEALTLSYPLYSGVDQALYELGNLYEKEANAMRRQNVPEAFKEKLVAGFQNHAIDAYTQIIKRYPAMNRAGDARRRLQALNAPVPTPTAEALAESKAEEQSRQSISLIQKTMDNFKKHPDTARAPKTGEPSLTEEVNTNAALMVQDLNNQLTRAAAASSQKLSIETIGGGSGAAPGPNQPPPGTSGASAQPATVNKESSSTESAPPSPAPAQVNEVQKTSATTPEDSTQTAAGSQQNSANGNQDSSSKKKGKKGLRKLLPF